jgi:tRNA modification GTPase
VQVEGVLAAVVAAGALPALPGEFTLRAFLNGRMDLVQAESVADLIAATTGAASRNALKAYGGALHDRLLELSDRLTRLRARLEAGIDFVDDDIPELEQRAILPEIDSLGAIASELADSYRVGRLLREGARVVICGQPNSGKSSLFNSLLKVNRSIVTDVPGTTRDAVTELLEIGGLPVILTDTAGLRSSSDKIESEGIRRAHELIRSADLVLSVIDLTAGVEEEADLPDNRLLLFNKSDLLSQSDIERLTRAWPGATVVSALRGDGIESLGHRIAERLGASWLQGNEAAVCRQRQHQALLSCKASLGVARKCLDNHEPLELAAIELRDAARAIDELVGRVYDEDILNRIFSEFCIGK